jgi:hypothetical protein
MFVHFNRSCRLSVMFLNQLKLHRESLESRLHRQGGASLDQELAQTRQFLTSTKDEKWKRQLLKRIKVLEASRSKGTDTADLQKRFKLVDALYQEINDHPDYNKSRKRRKPA